MHTRASRLWDFRARFEHAADVSQPIAAPS
jgi:hypothetical protein